MFTGNRDLYRDDPETLYQLDGEEITYLSEEPTLEDCPKTFQQTEEDPELCRHCGESRALH